MKRYLAEFLVAFFLVFAGVGAIMADAAFVNVFVRDSFGILGIALAHGLALGLAIAAVGRISGGYGNPAVSIAFWIARRMKFVDLIGYIFAQLLGGVAAAFFLKRVIPSEVVRFASGDVALGEGVGAFNGAAIEVMLTFFLVFVIWGVAVEKKGPKAIAPFAIGLTVTFGMLIGGAFTGAAMNPARWFGPALAAGELGRDWYVWVAGPILGALLASLLYETFFMEDDTAEVEVSYLADDDEDVLVTSGSVGGPGVEATDVSGRDESWRDTPSTYTPPSSAPPAVGPPSTMVPPSPPDAPAVSEPVSGTTEGTEAPKPSTWSTYSSEERRGDEGEKQPGV